MVKSERKNKRKPMLWWLAWLYMLTPPVIIYIICAVLWTTTTWYATLAVGGVALVVGLCTGYAFAGSYIADHNKAKRTSPTSFPSSTRYD